MSKALKYVERILDEHNREMELVHQLMRDKSHTASKILDIHYALRQEKKILDKTVVVLNSSHATSENTEQFFNLLEGYNELCNRQKKKLIKLEKITIKTTKKMMKVEKVISKLIEKTRLMLG